MVLKVPNSTMTNCVMVVKVFQYQIFIVHPSTMSLTLYLVVTAVGFNPRLHAWTRKKGQRVLGITSFIPTGPREPVLTDPPGPGFPNPVSPRAIGVATSLGGTRHTSSGQKHVQPSKCMAMYVGVGVSWVRHYVECVSYQSEGVV